MSPDSFLERFDPTVKTKRLEAEIEKLKCEKCANAVAPSGQWDRCVKCVKLLEAKIARLTKEVATSEANRVLTFTKSTDLANQLENEKLTNGNLIAAINQDRERLRIVTNQLNDTKKELASYKKWLDDVYDAIGLGGPNVAVVHEINRLKGVEKEFTLLEKENAKEGD